MGPIASDPHYYMQEFKYREVTRYNARGEVVQGCHAKTCSDICRHINKITDVDGGERNYFCVFVPVYNESVEQLMKTILSVMENIDFMKHEVKYHGDKIGKMLKKETSELEVVIVPVFDGMYEHQMSPSVREWLSGDFPGLLEGMPDGKGSENVRDLMTEEERKDDVEVRVALQRWWYYCLTNSDSDLKSAKELDPEEIGRLSESTLLKFVHGAHQDNIPNSYLHFHLSPIIKRTNHRKHNSLHWFIEGICSGLDTNLIFLTECSTTFSTSSVAHLTYEMLTRRSEVIAVCGKMRVEKPSRTFHPCRHTKIPFLRHRGEHESPASLPCWRCYAAYYCSCAPMQAFETELMQLINLPVFNIVEAVPVLYGPCTLMNWPKVKNLKVIEEFFDMMFADSSLSFGAVRAKRRRLPNIYLESEYSLLHPFGESDEEDDAVYAMGSSSISGLPTPSEFTADPHRETVDVSYDDFIREKDSNVSYLNEGHLHGADLEKGDKALSATQKGNGSKKSSKLMAGENSAMQIGTSSSAPISANSLQYYKLKLVDVLVAQLRLAEDRILSFVTVFCTGFGTKCVNSSVFYYEPEVTFDMILKQRRRWLNGMVMGFFFLFFSERAALHTEGGFLDTHKAFKSIKLVNTLWALNVLQSALSFISPSILLVALYKSLSATLNPEYAYFYHDDVFQFSVAALYTSLLMMMYVLWVLHVYYRHPSELLSMVMFLASGVATLTITYSFFLSQVRSSSEGEVSNSLVVFLFAFLAPLGFAATQSLEVAFVYLSNAPWFFLYAGFYLMFIPSYAFARLWDTRWGNRYTKGDRSLGTVRQDMLKRYAWWFNLFLVLANVLITVCCCLDRNNVAVPTIFVCILLPTLVQFSGGVLYMYLVAPIKALFGSRKDKDERYHAIFEERFNVRVKKKKKKRGDEGSDGVMASEQSARAVPRRRANSAATWRSSGEVVEQEVDSDEEREMKRHLQDAVLSQLGTNHKTNNGSKSQSKSRSHKSNNVMSSQSGRPPPPPVPPSKLHH